MAGVGFDAFGWELWPYLCSGASLYMIDDDLRVNPSQLVDFFIANNITHSFIATALIPDFVSETTNKKLSLQYLLTGGDKLPAINVNDLTYRLVNNYGPSENTVVASSYELSASNNSWLQDPR
jgi:non-ribosomal peptide synthetase component F